MSGGHSNERIAIASVVALTQLRHQRESDFYKPRSPLPNRPAKPPELEAVKELFCMGFRARAKGRKLTADASNEMTERFPIDKSE